MESFFSGLLHTLTYLGIVYAGMSVVERIAPAEPNQPFKRTMFNLGLTPILLLISGGLLMILSPLVQHLMMAPMGQRIRVELPWEGTLGLAASSLLVMLALMFVTDFVYYWWHRFQHTNRWLWAQHTLHHSERSLNVVASLRHHWLEDPMRLFIQNLPLGYAFFFAPPSVVWVGTIIGLWPFFIHMNLRLSLGPLTPVFGGPQYHRIHHSILPEHHDKNFAAFFPIWDIIFGTAWLPKKNDYPPTGIEGVDIQSVPKALFSPFVDWARMSREVFIKRLTKFENRKIKTDA
jgi:sterol desaturase/sphingolipid hydroxylase (fatty acid hydroxylase superfamily)